MLGTRQVSAPAPGRSILALSTLALLALCCLPALAFGSSAGYQYQDAPPTATGKPASESNHDGGSSSTSGVGSPTGKSNSAGGDSAGKKSSNGGSGGASTKGSGGSGGGGANAQQGGQANGGKAAPPSTKSAGSSAEPGSDGGNSSPLGPILVGVAILAGCSIAYVMYRRRRAAESDSSDSSPSPEAS
jgi:cobalamin biosynthesis Mg chelatase CobN